MSLSYHLLHYSVRMGSSQSSYTKDEIVLLAGELFNEELWQEYSTEGNMTHKQLYVLKNTLSYTQRHKMTGGTFEIVSTGESAKLNAQGMSAIDASLLLLSGEVTSLAPYFSSEKLLILNIGSCT